MTREEAVEKLEAFAPMVVDDTREALDMAIEALEEIPKRRKEAKRWKRKALQAEPVKHGKWKYIANEIMKNRHGILGDIYSSPMFMNYECSECKFHIANELKGITDHRTAYCPNCGAKMKGTEE